MPVRRRKRSLHGITAKKVVDTGALLGYDSGMTKEVIMEKPVEGVDRCYCGSKYWDENVCHSCGEKFVKREEEDQ